MQIDISSEGFFSETITELAATLLLQTQTLTAPFVVTFSLNH